MYSITISLTEPRPDHALLLVPNPPATWRQRLVDFATEGGALIETVTAINSRQEAWVVKPESPALPVIRYAFDDAEQTAPDWLWTRIENRHTRASPALRRLVADLTRHCCSDTEKLQILMGHAAERFDYDHPLPEERFNHGHDTVPALTCGTTPGSCTDINTYLLGALGCASIQTAYMAGFFFAAGRPTTHGMHCWLATRSAGHVEFWDIAHHKRFAIEPLGPGLNPAPGIRFAMSVGRGLIFEVGGHSIELGHFAEPVWLLDDGRQRQAGMEARLVAITPTGP
jgi:hypothetical protein